MASLPQIEANRRNSQLSTGPRTEAGKASSRSNSFRHGIDARALVIPGEKHADLAALTREYYDEFQPVGPRRTFLVDTMIHADWFRRRYARIEAELTTAIFVEQEGSLHPLGDIFNNERGARLISRAHLRYEAANRDWFRAHRELKELMAEADAAAEPEPAPQAVAPQPPQPEIGFVPQICQSTPVPPILTPNPQSLTPVPVTAP
jgi:hypothetical protein